MHEWMSRWTGAYGGTWPFTNTLVDVESLHPSHAGLAQQVANNTSCQLKWLQAKLKQSIGEPLGLAFSLLEATLNSIVSERVYRVAI